MRGGEGVVDIDIAELGQCIDEGGIVLLLRFVEAGVLQQHDVAVLHRGDRLRRNLADAIGGEADRAAEVFGDGRGDGPQRIGFVRPALGPAEMGEQDHLAALVGDFADRRQHALDAGRVADLAVLHRHVEIDAQQHALALHLGGVEGAEGMGHGWVAFEESENDRRPGGQVERTASSNCQNVGMFLQLSVDGRQLDCQFADLLSKLFAVDANSFSAASMRRNASSIRSIVHLDPIDPLLERRNALLQHRIVRAAASCFQ